MKELCGYLVMLPFWGRTFDFRDGMYYTCSMGRFQDGVYVKFEPYGVCLLCYKHNNMK